MVSSSARPSLYQHFIPGKTNEIASFAACFEAVNRRFVRSFEIVTGDAGNCSRENARIVHEANKAYVFAVKDNQPNLLLSAQSKLGAKTAPDDANRQGENRTVERYRGAEMTREIFCIDVKDADADFPTALNLWRVRSTTVRRTTSGKEFERIAEDRYFVTNRRFSAERALLLVRLHWGIENGANWTLDVQVGEDASCPCTDGNGVIVVSWLRQIAGATATLA